MSLLFTLPRTADETFLCPDFAIYTISKCLMGGAAGWGHCVYFVFEKRVTVLSRKCDNGTLPPFLLLLLLLL